MREERVKRVGEAFFLALPASNACAFEAIQVFRARSLVPFRLPCSPFLMGVEAFSLFEPYWGTPQTPTGRLRPLHPQKVSGREERASGEGSFKGFDRGVNVFQALVKSGRNDKDWHFIGQPLI